MAKQQVALGGFILLVVAGIAGGILVFNAIEPQPNSTSQPLPTVSVITPTPTAPGELGTEQASEPALNSQQYQDGIYTTTGSYNSPAGRESVRVSLTLADDIVVDSTVTSLTNHPTSRQYQGEFVAGYKQYVTGKKLTEINISRVSGSSLTSGGFNQALAAITNEAQL